MSKKIYDIDFNKMVVWLTADHLKKDRRIAFFQALIKPIITTYLEFKRVRTAKIYQLTITPQVCYLQRLLNDRYDYVQRRIEIIDAADKPPLYTFTVAENKPVFLGSKYIYTGGEAGAIKDDFIIKVPQSIVFEQAEMLALIKSYRLAAMIPKIQLV